VPTLRPPGRKRRARARPYLARWAQAQRAPRAPHADGALGGDARSGGDGLCRRGRGAARQIHRAVPHVARAPLVVRSLACAAGSPCDNASHGP
jgi:hypothetical protein